MHVKSILAFDKSHRGCCIKSKSTYLGTLLVLYNTEYTYVSKIQATAPRGSSGREPGGGEGGVSVTRIATSVHGMVQYSLDTHTD